MPTRPYGSWPTPVTSELVVRAARAVGSVAFDGDDVWWSEGRPEEGGRNAVLRRADGVTTEVLGEPGNARTGVHEYGGGAWWVRDGVLWFADWPTQRLHRLDPGAGAPVALTPAPDVPRGLRYADGDVSPDGTTILCVRESHPSDGAEVVNELVRLSAIEPSEPEVVVAGPDFVAGPRWSPDGSAWCWIEWDHPDMPWDATRLVVTDGATRTVVAGADGSRESICQAAWAPDGSLWFSGDRSGFWSLYRWRRGGGVEAMVEMERDVGFPHWVFGESCFAFLDGGRVAFRFVEDGLDRLAVRSPDGMIRRLDLPYTAVGSLRGRGSTLLFVGATPTTELHGVAVEVVAGEVGALDVVVAPRDLGLDDSWWSVPEPIEFPTPGGIAAHALLYRPRHPDCEGPPGERPPLIVVIHGGPTSAARVHLKLAYQYWTTRGFAVVDVNHRGSTGYGRAFRDLLQGQWGIIDVEDCAAVARLLGERGDVDPARLCIRGGSAGGFTTLAALAFQDVFAAGASHYGIADLGALARETHKFESRYLDGLVGPWPAARAVYEARSPLYHVDAIDCPLIVFQGLDDEVVPPDQAELIVEAVRAKGLPVRYVAFEGEGHGFRQAANIRAALDAELAFYAEVLGSPRLGRVLPSK
jgi:dipeptidyl aminopeptidase/acylaminoacyl peptidase